MRVIIILTIITTIVKWAAEVVKWVLVRGLHYLPALVLDFHERAAKSDLLALSALLLQTSIVLVSTVH